jgi:glutamate/tyrosine decarboxylase-like PLP-dependent enzyme
MHKASRPDDPMNIPSFGRMWQGEFLDRDEGNAGALLKKLEWLLEQMCRQRPIRSGRRDVDSWFRYPEELVGLQLPQKSRSFEEAAMLSLEAFEGCIRWHDPNALFNITPSPLLDTVALTALVALYNPNALWDMTSGKFVLIEKKVAHYLSQLVGWNPQSSGGLFTYGGKATLLYAIRAGLNRCDRGSVSRGLDGQYVVITGETCHFSIENLCNLSGIGQQNCLRVPAGENGAIDLICLRDTLEEQIRRGRKIACIIVSGGGTMNLSIDPVHEVATLIDQTVDKFGLPYQPYLHSDSVISWVWLFMQPEASAESLGVTERVAERLRRTARAVKETCHADSFGVDFHKTGLSPYATSCFMFKNRAELRNLNNTHTQDVEEEEWFGDSRNFDRTLENSRPCMGIISAFHVIERLGVEGFQQYLAYSVSVSEAFRHAIIEEFGTVFETVNLETMGFEVVVKIHFFGDRRSYRKICSRPVVEREQYGHTCDQFFEFVTFGTYCNSHDVPFIGYVPKYKCENHGGGCPAYLLYPVSVHITCQDVLSILGELAGAVRRFEEAKESGNFVPRKVLKGMKEPPK